MQAVNASDYAIPEFRFLWKLVLVFGRWNYIRITQYILFYFYKNFLFCIPQVVFGFLNFFSASPIYDAK